MAIWPWQAIVLKDMYQYLINPSQAETQPNPLIFCMLRPSPSSQKVGPVKNGHFLFVENCFPQGITLIRKCSM